MATFEDLTAAIELQLELNPKSTRRDFVDVLRREMWMDLQIAVHVSTTIVSNLSKNGNAVAMVWIQAWNEREKE